MAVSVACKPGKHRGRRMRIAEVLGMASEGLGWGVRKLVAPLLSRNLVAKHRGEVS